MQDMEELFGIPNYNQIRAYFLYHHYGVLNQYAKKNVVQYIHGHVEISELLILEFLIVQNLDKLLFSRAVTLHTNLDLQSSMKYKGHSNIIYITFYRFGQKIDTLTEMDIAVRSPNHLLTYAKVFSMERVSPNIVDPAEGLPGMALSLQI
ncbi:hypothetical protein ACJX0J_011895, partial [Zea mays]